MFLEYVISVLNVNNKTKQFSETAIASCSEKVVLKCTDSNLQAATERHCLTELFLKIKQKLWKVLVKEFIFN